MPISGAPPQNARANARRTPANNRVNDTAAPSLAQRSPFIST